MFLRFWTAAPLRDAEGAGAGAGEGTGEDDGAPVTQADKPREPTEYEKTLRRESRRYREQARAARAEIDSVRASLAAERDAAIAAERRAGTERLVRAELKAAAMAAGMHSPEALRMLDVSAVTLNDAGEVVIPAGFFDAAKASHPYLFKQTGAQTGTTGSTTPPPAATPPTAKRATEMTDAEFKAGLRGLGVRI
jgi:hypothetical protein